jgi:hypothetical protein
MSAAKPRTCNAVAASEVAEESNQNDERNWDA